MNFKGSLIYFVLIAIFLLTVIFFGDSIIVFAVIILFMLVYSYHKWKNIHVAEKEVKSVVNSHINPNAQWPTKVTIPEEQLKRLGIILASKKILLPQATINKMVTDALAKEMELRFETSFYAHNPDLPRDPTIYHWIRAYVTTFNKKMEYLPLLQRLMKKRGVRYSLAQLEEKIKEELENQEGDKRQLKQLKRQSPA